MSNPSVDQLATAFLDGRLAKSEWTHEAHLRVGLWHLLHHSPAEALDLLRQRIRAYNAATGTENTDSSGYHETITRFYVGVIERFLKIVDRTRSIDDLADELIAKYGDRRLPLEYWSKERLFSVEARSAWVEPDKVRRPF